MLKKESVLDRFHPHSDGKLGQGANGSVYRVCDTQTGNCNLVMKVFPKWYQDQHDECLATAVAALKHFGPGFHGCWSLSDSWKKVLARDLPDPDQSYVGMILDLGGMSLLQYLVSEKDLSVRNRMYNQVAQLYRNILMDSFSHDQNNENWIVRPICKEGKQREEISAIDWTKADLPGHERKIPSSLKEKLLVEKKVLDFLTGLKRDVQIIESQVPRVKTAIQRRQWLYNQGFHVCD